VNLFPLLPEKHINLSEKSPKTGPSVWLILKLESFKDIVHFSLDKKLWISYI
jgi:hypothetical protein